jgi:hypothetical protein
MVKPEEAQGIRAKYCFIASCEDRERYAVFAGGAEGKPSLAGVSLIALYLDVGMDGCIAGVPGASGHPSQMKRHKGHG